MTIAGTRPELIKLSEVIKKADTFFEHMFVHTGQNYDSRLNEIFYSDLGLRTPDVYLDVAQPDLGVTMGNIISKHMKSCVLISPTLCLSLGTPTRRFRLFRQSGLNPHIPHGGR
jgi:UDP-N-acetylglucosamine 2-epimerase (non-hydrolysing)